MPLVKPVIYPLAPFDAREDYLLAYFSESYFDTYQLRITDQSDQANTITLSGSYDGSGNILIPRNTLVNSQIITETVDGERVERLTAKRYACQLFISRTLPNPILEGEQSPQTAGTAEEECSLVVFFRCQDTPILSIAGIPENGEVISQTLHLGGSYSQLQGDPLKTFQYHLFDSAGKLIGGTKRIFGTEIEGSIEQLDNKTTYYIQLECETQAGMRALSPQIPFVTAYDQSLMFAALHFDMDTELAKLSLSADLTEFTGSGAHFSYSDNDFVDLSEQGAYVAFHDRYEIIDESFLLKLWLKNIPEKKSFLHLSFIDAQGHPLDKQIEVCYYDERFHAFKKSCGLNSHYVSESAAYQPGELVFLALRHYNNQIDLYTSHYPVQEVSA